MRTFVWGSAALLATAITACAPAAEMRPGQSCGSCHASSAARSFWSKNAPEFGAAGTLYRDAHDERGLAGATVEVVDHEGRRVSMTTNAAGNFYTTARLAPPLRVSVASGGRYVTPLSAMASGDCNACHTSASHQARVHVGTTNRRLP